MNGFYSGRKEKLFNEQKFTEQWVNKEISTYDYLMYINLLS